MILGISKNKIILVLFIVIIALTISVMYLSISISHLRERDPRHGMPPGWFNQSMILYPFLDSTVARFPEKKFQDVQDTYQPSYKDLRLKLEKLGGAIPIMQFILKASIPEHGLALMKEKHLQQPAC